MSLLESIDKSLDASVKQNDNNDEAPVTEVPAHETPAADQPDWYYDVELKGNGERPDWLKPKYKTMADQAKAYTELEKKLGAFTGAPESYDLTLPDHPEIKFTDDDPLIKDFVDFAKSSNMSQDHVSHLLNVYAQAMTMNMPDPVKEMESLGANAQQDLQILNNWASSTLNQQEYQAFKSLVTTADAFRVFEKLRQVSTQSVISPGGSQNTRETKAQVLRDVHDPRYETDEGFREEVRKRLSVAIG